MAITMRKGLLSDFNPNRLLAGEWAVSIDPETKNQIVYMCFGAGIVKRMGTLEDFEEWFNTAFNNAIEPYEDVFNEIKDECEAIEADTRALEAQVITIRNSIINTYMPQIETAVASAESSAQDAQEAKDWIDNNFDIDIEKKSTVGLVDTYEITYQNTKTFDFDVTNGSKGDKGDKGDTGEGFEIFKTYPSIQDMEDDSANVPEGKFVLISTSVETEDNAKLYVKADTGFNFLTDLSGAQGIKGEKGDTGLGIASVTMADENKNHPITVAYTDGTSEVIGTIKDGQDGAGNIATYTTAGVVMPDSETITIDADGKIHAIGGSTDDIWEGTKSEYEAEKADIKDGTVVVINDDNADLPTFIDNNDLALTNGVLSLSGSVKDNLSQINTKLSNIDDSADWLKSKNLVNKDELDNVSLSQGQVIESSQRVGTPNMIYIDSSKTYTLSVSSANNVELMQLDEYDSSGTRLQWNNLKGNTTYVYTPLNSNVASIRFCLHKTDDSNISVNEVVNLQLELGSSATDYAPYAMSNVELTDKISAYENSGYLNKNMFTTDNAVNWTFGTKTSVNSFSVNGALNPYAHVMFKFTLKSGNYTFSFSSPYSGNIGIRVFETNANNDLITEIKGETTTNSNRKVSFTIPSEKLYAVLAYGGGIGDCSELVTYNNVQLEMGEATSFQPYAKTNSQLTKELSWVKTDSNFSSSDNVTVPISAKEINVLAHLGSKYSNVTYQILTSNIPLNEKYYYRGGYYNSATDNQGITITVEHLSTSFSVGVANAYAGGTEKTSNIVGIVNYR